MKTCGVGIALVLALSCTQLVEAKGLDPDRAYDLLGVKHEAKFELSGGKVAWLEGGTTVLLLKRRGDKCLVMVPGAAGYAIGCVYTNSVEPLNASRRAWGSALDAKLPAKVQTPIGGARSVRDVLTVGLVRRMQLGFGADILAAPGDRRHRFRIHEPEAVSVLGTYSYHNKREGDRWTYAYVLYHGATGYVDMERMHELEPLPAKNALHKRDPAALQLSAASVQREGLLLYGGQGKAVAELPLFGRLKVVRETWNRLYVYAEGDRGGVRGVLSRDGLKFDGGLKRFSAYNVDASYFDLPEGLLGQEQAVEATEAVQQPVPAGLAGELADAVIPDPKGSEGARPVPDPEPVQAVVRPILKGKIRELLADAPVRSIRAGTVVWREAQPHTGSNYPELFTVRVDVKVKVLGEAINSSRTYVYLKGATGYVESTDLR